MVSLQFSSCDLSNGNYRSARYSITVLFLLLVCRCRPNVYMPKRTSARVSLVVAVITAMGNGTDCGECTGNGIHTAVEVRNCWSEV